MTRVKICGLTNAEDAQVAAEAGADFLGFIFYPPSPRYVSPERVHRIIEAIRSASFTVRCVGVFVDEKVDDVRQTARQCGLDYAQLHGTEPPETVTALMTQGLGAIKAFRVRDGASLDEIARYRASAYLLDTYVKDRPGGTGVSFDWTLAARAKAHGPVILAGGLNADNVEEAIRTAEPWAVDVATGVETEPGRKDPAEVRRFIATVKGTRR